MNLIFSLFLACSDPPPAAGTSTKPPQKPNNSMSNDGPGGNPNGDPSKQQTQGNNQASGGTPPGGPPPDGPGGAPGGQPDGAPPDQPNEQFGYPEADGEIIKDSITIKINDSGNGDPPPQYTQESIKEIDYVSLKGTISCTGDDCSSPMILRVVPFQEQTPNGKPLKESGGIITVKNISSLGEYEVFVPKGKKPLVFELLVDSNGDGKPTNGERMALLERGGQIVPSEALKGLDLNASPVESFGPIGGAVSPDAPTAKPPQQGQLEEQNPDQNTNGIGKPPEEGNKEVEPPPSE
ncbi:MAG: hypothetical protein VX278_10600 [Myxococcota bacterium]|nr:hypothetical protein [Myxococcota bacterium]